jgi:hypothetical protein
LTTSALDGIRAILEQTIAQGLGEVDYSALYETINPAAKPQRS